MAQEEQVTRRSLSPLLPRYDFGDPLWHVTTEVHGAGALLVARDCTDAHNRAVEEAFEAARPRDCVSRRACVLTTDQPQLLQAALRENPGLRLYRVQVPSRASASGRFDRQLLGPKAPPDAATEYWTRGCNTKTPIRTEVLATEIMIVAPLPAAFVDAVRKLTRDLTPSELMDGKLSF